jgi:lipoyl(octanoyl) transferase
VEPFTPCRVRRLARVEYLTALERMQAFTQTRGAETPDEIWLLEHPPVYTLGLRARNRLLRPGNDVPIACADRGGDVTYHGPGQPIVYVLLDLARRRLGIHALVRALEQSVIDMLQALGVAAARRPGAPGVYVADRKIASLGLRVRAGRSYHGVALNTAMDLAPFEAIDPCGFPGLRATQLAEWRPDVHAADAGERLLRQVLLQLGYTEASMLPPSPSDRVDVHHARR